MMDVLAKNGGLFQLWCFIQGLKADVSLLVTPTHPCMSHSRIPENVETTADWPGCDVGPTECSRAPSRE